ncbi:MAG: hypothetical protein IKD10_06235 [Lentisphaeria bacterium]|nr:hypothetical protein [Lentisphaeria bacterium]
MSREKIRKIPKKTIEEQDIPQNFSDQTEKISASHWQSGVFFKLKEVISKLKNPHFFSAGKNSHIAGIKIEFFMAKSGKICHFLIVALDKELFLKYIHSKQV